MKKILLILPLLFWLGCEDEKEEDKTQQIMIGKTFGGSGTDQETLLNKQLMMGTLLQVEQNLLELVKVMFG
jgi:hypothetical protein